MENILTILESGSVAYLTINRPENLNAINSDLIHKLYSEISKIDKNENIKVIVLKGSGEKAFVAGADIKEMQAMDESLIASYIRTANSLMLRIEKSPKIFVAVVDGYALGGGLELALSCDLIVVSDNSKLGFPEVSLGLMPGFGGTQRLTQKCGTGVAKKLTLTGDMISAKEAKEDGIIEYLYDKKELNVKVKELVENINSMSSKSLAMIKKVISESISPALIPGLEIEQAGFLELFNSEEAKKKMKEFINKGK